MAIREGQVFSLGSCSKVYTLSHDYVMMGECVWYNADFYFRVEDSLLECQKDNTEFELGCITGSVLQLGNLTSSNQKSTKAT